MVPETSIDAHCDFFDPSRHMHRKKSHLSGDAGVCADAAFGANEPVIRSCRRVDLAYTMLEVASIWLVGGDVAAKISVV